MADTDIREYVPLAPYTLYKIGGPARYFAEARNAEETERALRFAAEKRLGFFILGAGSNILVADEGFDGMVIRMIGGDVKIEGERMTVDAGVAMARAAAEAARAGLAGFEWAVGVPGTIGGSVRGNAGCFGGEMRDIVESVRVLDTGNSNPESSGFELLTVNNSDCEFAYRHSIFKRYPERVIVSATLRLKKGDPARIQDEIRMIISERGRKQDVGAKCCGCIFKNPAWPGTAEEKEDLMRRFPELAEYRKRATIPAAFLLDRALAKGERAGNAAISRKHANFFVNEGVATARDITALIGRAQNLVAARYGIALKEEIQRLGF